MPTIRATSLRPQRRVGEIGWIQFATDSDISAGEILSISGCTDGALKVRQADPKDTHLPKMIARTDSSRSAVVGITYTILDNVDTKKKKEGTPIFLAKNGKWTLTPGAIQVGIVAREGSVLLCPSLVSGGVANHAAVPQPGRVEKEPSNKPAPKKPTKTAAKKSATNRKK